MPQRDSFRVEVAPRARLTRCSWLPTLRRRYNTLLVYVDPGRYTITKTGANTPVKKEVPDKLAPGSSVFHRKDSIVSELRVDQDYRVLYVEMK